MLCEEIKDNLYEYIYEELSEDIKNQIREHLKGCCDCNQEYIYLKALLIDDLDEVINLKNKIHIPEGLEQKIMSSLSIQKRPIPFFKYVAAACLIIMLVYSVPVAAALIVDNTALNKYITFDKGLVKDIKDGRIQYINKTSTMKDINFRVDAIVKKQDKVTVLFTFKVPQNQQIDYAMPKGLSTVSLEDQFGRVYNNMGSAISVETANMDGEATALMDFEPLSSTSFKLTLRITALETGKLVPMTEEEIKKLDSSQKFYYKMRKEKNIYGKWQVDFYVDKSIRNK